MTPASGFRLDPNATAPGDGGPPLYGRVAGPRSKALPRRLFSRRSI